MKSVFLQAKKASDILKQKKNEKNKSKNKNKQTLKPLRFQRVK